MKLSDVSHANLEENSRQRKAQKMTIILRQFKSLKDSRVIDVGTGSGHIAHELSKTCKRVDSVDLNDERILRKGYVFHKVDDEKLPFSNGLFDIAISNHVLEHVPNQKMHLNEIHRVLKRGGILYLATPNRWWFIDPHYKIPFINWFSYPIANAYFKLFRKKKWDIYSLSFGSIKKLTKGKFHITNISLRILKDPRKYRLDVYKPLQPLLPLIPSFVFRMFNFILPTYVLVLRKK